MSFIVSNDVIQQKSTMHACNRYGHSARTNDKIVAAHFIWRSRPKMTSIESKSWWPCHLLLRCSCILKISTNMSCRPDTKQHLGIVWCEHVWRSYWATSQRRLVSFCARTLMTMDIEDVSCVLISPIKEGFVLCACFWSACYTICFLTWFGTSRMALTLCFRIPLLLCKAWFKNVAWTLPNLQ